MIQLQQNFNDSIDKILTPEQPPQSDKILEASTVDNGISSLDLNKLNISDIKIYSDYEVKNMTKGDENGENDFYPGGDSKFLGSSKQQENQKLELESENPEAETLEDTPSKEEVKCLLEATPKPIKESKSSNFSEKLKNSGRSFFNKLWTPSKEDLSSLNTSNISSFKPICASGPYQTPTVTVTGLEDKNSKIFVNLQSSDDLRVPSLSSKQTKKSVNFNFDDSMNEIRHKKFTGF